MKLTSKKLKQLILEEMEQMESQMSSLPGDSKNYPAGAEKFGSRQLAEARTGGCKWGLQATGPGYI